MSVSDGDSVHQMSPSQVSVEEDGSTDSFIASEDISDAYNLARDKSLISRALETVAKVRLACSGVWSKKLCYHLPDQCHKDSVKSTKC